MKQFTPFLVLLISSSLYAQIPVNPGGGGGGGGTVTSVSASGGSPIISVSVATATSTPAITLSTPVATPRSLYGNPNAGSIAPVFTIDPMVNTVTANTMTANNFVGNLSGSAASAGFATSLFNGALGSVPYQSGANATAFLAGQTTTGTYLLGEQPTGSLIAPTFLNFATLMASPGSIGSGTPGTAAFTTASATTFTGALSGNATTATSATSATSATIATNLAGGTTGGDLPYQSAANTTSLVTGNITTTLNVLSQTGNATVSAAPAWLPTTGTGNVVRAISPTLTGTTTVGALSTLGNVTTPRWMPSGSAPTIAVGAGAGTTTPSATVLAGSAPAIGQLTITTGSVVGTAGVVATVSFAATVTPAPRGVFLMPASAAAATALPLIFVGAPSTTAWTINNSAPLVTGAVLTYFYFVL